MNTYLILNTRIGNIFIHKSINDWSLGGTLDEKLYVVMGRLIDKKWHYHQVPNFNSEVGYYTWLASDRYNYPSIEVMKAIVESNI